MKNKSITKLTKTPKPATLKPTWFLEDGWIDIVDVLELLHISRRTLARWRLEKGLAFTKVGNKMFFQKSSIHAFLLANQEKVVRPQKNNKGQMIRNGEPKPSFIKHSGSTALITQL